MFARPASTASLLLLCLTTLSGETIEDSPNQFGALRSIGMIAVLICTLRRKHAIGGWLLYFLFQVLLGSALSIFSEAVAYGSYFPGAWISSRDYLWFLLMTLPVLIAKIFIITGCIMLVKTREWIWVERLKWILVGFLLCGSLAYIIERQFFPDSFGMPFAVLFVHALFLVYLALSDRVCSVFLLKDWDRTSQSTSVLGLESPPAS